MLKEKLEIVSEIQELLCDTVLAMNGCSRNKNDPDRRGRLKALFIQLQGHPSPNPLAGQSSHTTPDAPCFSCQRPD